jgi:hypothetical protein
MSAQPHQLLWQARQIAEAHGLFIVEVQDQIGQVLVTAYVVYRRAPNGARAQRLGKSRKPAGVLRLVRKAAGVTA